MNDYEIRWTFDCLIDWAFNDSAKDEDDTETNVKINAEINVDIDTKTNVNVDVDADARTNVTKNSIDANSTDATRNRSRWDAFSLNSFFRFRIIENNLR